MKPSLIDTDILSMFLRGNPEVTSKVEEYLSSYPTLNISILTYYEILSGLKYKHADKHLDSFLELCKVLSVIPLTEKSSEKSAEIYASLRQKGEIIDDMDILIAGICLDNNFALVTNNTKHFTRINEMEIMNWSK